MDEVEDIETAIVPPPKFTMTSLINWTGGIFLVGVGLYLAGFFWQKGANTANKFKTF